MNNKILILISVLLCGFVVWYLFIVTPLKKNPQEINNRVENNTEVQENLNDKKLPPTPYPVSLPALMNKDFNGQKLTLGEVLENNTAYTRHYITYQSGELTISGILNIPKGTVPEGGWPVIFLNHGHIDTSVYTNGRGLKREQDYLARQGFAVFHSDYRNHAQSDKDPENEENLRLGYIEDVINAVYAVKNSDIENLSKERFGMLGHSMGGGITQAVMVVAPELIDAAILYAPVSSNIVDSYNRWTLRSGEVVKKIEELHGSPSDNPEFWKNMSPSTFFDKVEIPTLIFHGTNDESCDLEWSRTTRDVLVSKGKQVELIEYEDELHEFIPFYQDFMKRSTEFFNKNI